MPKEQHLENSLKGMLSALENYASNDDIAKVFETLMSVMKEVKDYVDTCVVKMDKEKLIEVRKCMFEISQIEDTLRESMLSSSRATSDELDKISKNMMKEIVKVKDMIPTMPDLTHLERAISAVEAKIPIIKDTILDTPFEIRDKLESIKDEKDKLEIEAIKDLRAELDELRRIFSSSKGVTIFGGGSAGGRIMRVYDLTDQLNGVLKTFTLPAFWRIISVHSTSSPTIFRPTVDYTVDTSAHGITFTDEIDAATTLATGQTLIITYSE